MIRATRTFPLLMSIVPLLLALAGPAGAQEAPPAGGAVGAETATAPPPEAAVEPIGAPAGEPRGGYEIRSEFGSVLRQHPPELATILALDPTLLSNPAFLSGYPELARFVDEHPEVRSSPRFYLGEFHSAYAGSLDSVMEMLTIFGAFLVMTLGLAWLLRTIIEQKRWSRLSRTQAEVHNKILERFGTSEALLEYMRSPAGTKFLESAPIPLRTEPPVQNAPVARALWSIQLGVVAAAGALGMLLVSGRLERDAAEGFFALGVIGLCVGVGFIASAVVSLVVSRRLGLWQEPGAVRSGDLEDAGLTR